MVKNGNRELGMDLPTQLSCVYQLHMNKKTTKFVTNGVTMCTVHTTLLLRHDNPGPRGFISGKLDGCYFF